MFSLKDWIYNEGILAKGGRWEGYGVVYMRFYVWFEKDFQKFWNFFFLREKFNRVLKINFYCLDRCK